MYKIEASQTTFCFEGLGNFFKNQLSSLSPPKNTGFYLNLIYVFTRISEFSLKVLFRCEYPQFRNFCRIQTSLVLFYQNIFGNKYPWENPRSNLLNQAFLFWHYFLRTAFTSYRNCLYIFIIIVKCLFQVDNKYGIQI